MLRYKIHKDRLLINDFNILEVPAGSSRFHYAQRFDIKNVNCDTNQNNLLLLLLFVACYVFG